jgi:hypothetical protein
MAIGIDVIEAPDCLDELWWEVVAGASSVDASRHPHWFAVRVAADPHFGFERWVLQTLGHGKTRFRSRREVVPLGSTFDQETSKLGRERLVGVSHSGDELRQLCLVSPQPQALHCLAECDAVIHTEQPSF